MFYSPLVSAVQFLVSVFYSPLACMDAGTSIMQGANDREYLPLPFLVSRRYDAFWHESLDVSLWS